MSIVEKRSTNAVLVKVENNWFEIVTINTFEDIERNVNGRAEFVPEYNTLNKLNKIKVSLAVNERGILENFKRNNNDYKVSHTNIYGKILIIKLDYVGNTINLTEDDLDVIRSCFSNPEKDEKEK